jgi:hypothetical protein
MVFTQGDSLTRVTYVQCASAIDENCNRHKNSYKGPTPAVKNYRYIIKNCRADAPCNDFYKKKPLYPAQGRLTLLNILKPKSRVCFTYK